MKEYIIGAAMLVGTLSGAVYGYCFNENFPYVTRYAHSGMENSFTKKATGVVGGATSGLLGAAVVTLLLKHYIERLSKN